MSVDDPWHKIKGLECGGALVAIQNPFGDGYTISCLCRKDSSGKS